MKDIAVWDKAAFIKFLRPGYGTLTATFDVSQEDMEEVVGALGTKEVYEKNHKVVLLNAENKSVMEVEKLLHFRKKKHRH